MKNLIEITEAINANKELLKGINKVNTHYNIENFINDANDWISAIKDNRMLCVIPHISKSGMSRVLKYNSFQSSIVTPKKGYYRQYMCFLLALGYKENKNYNGVNIGDCGMDMNFNTNYCIIHDLKRLGFISDAECRDLAKNTPTVL